MGRFHLCDAQYARLLLWMRLCLAIVRQSADYAMAIDATAVRDKLPTLKVQGRFFGSARNALYPPHGQPYIVARIILMVSFVYF